MIITRSPLRISLGGGGTDLPSFYANHNGGFLVAAAISKYVYIALHGNFDPGLIIKYSQIERVAQASEIRHPLLREALIATDVDQAIEVISMADIPAGTGLGSSGAFTVALLKALHAFRHRPVTNEELASLAAHIEIDVLHEPVGKQDQYASGIGGLTAFHFHPDHSVEIEPIVMPHEARLRLEENLLLFYTGLRRSASEELSAQFEESPDAAASSLTDNLKAVRRTGQASYEALRRGDLGEFAERLTEQWLLKFDRSPSPLHQRVDGWIKEGLAAGAVGGKLVGAGGGGFILFLADAKSDLRLRMTELGLDEVRFAFDYEGVKALVV
jgi:D-glycero-alpha-D-manno-heptose-7-phosphate kinase